MVERCDDEMVLRDVDFLGELLRGWGEDDRGFEMRGVFLQGFHVDGEDGALREGFGEAFRFPVFVEFYDDLAFEHSVDLGLEGERDFFGAVGGVERDFALEEVDATGEEDELVALGVVEDAGACAYVSGLAAEDLLGLIEGLAALPDFGDEGVAGLRHGPRTPVARDDEGVFVDPFGVLLGLGQGEAVLDELASLKVELAEGLGVFAAGGELDEAEAVAGVDAVEALLNPFFVVLFGEGVVVDDGLPVRFVGEVAGEGGFAEDAADVLGVLPGVVDFADAEVWAGQPGGRFEDLEGGFLKLGVVRVGLKDFCGALVLGVDPCHGAVAGDVFEPLVFVGLLYGICEGVFCA